MIILRMLFALSNQPTHSQHPSVQAFQEEVTTFNDRNDWLLAVNAVTIASPSWLVDFDYITTDIDLSVNGTDFDDTNGQPQINIAVVNPSPNFPSFIDAAPFVFTNDLDFTTTFAFLFVEADDNISVTMSFKEDNTFAWGGDFENTINGGEGLELELTFVNGTTISDDFAPTASDGFFGFTLKSEFLEQIRFKAASVIPGQVGEGFSFDNVAGANKEPSSAPSSEPSAAPSAGPSVSPSSTPSTEASAVENDDDDNFIA